MQLGGLRVFCSLGVSNGMRVRSAGLRTSNHPEQSHACHCPSPQPRPHPACPASKHQPTPSHTHLQKRSTAEEPEASVPSRSAKKPGHSSGYSCAATATMACATLLRRKGGSAAAPGPLPAAMRARGSAVRASGGRLGYECRARVVRVWAHQKRTST